MSKSSIVKLEIVHGIYSRHHKFHPQSFHVLSESAPESSLATLQTLQSRLRDLAIKNRLKEREIKVTDFGSAAQLLSFPCKGRHLQIRPGFVGKGGEGHPTAGKETKGCTHL